MRASQDNYMRALNLVDAMHNEWKYRYDHPAEKMHKSFIVATYLKKYAPSADKFSSMGLTPFALAMPVECKCEDPIEAYRKYISNSRQTKNSFMEEERKACMVSIHNKQIKIKK